jgi:hypothetical protein
MIERLLEEGAGLVFDIKGVLSQQQKPAEIELWRL